MKIIVNTLILVALNASLLFAQTAPSAPPQPPAPTLTPAPVIPPTPPKTPEAPATETTDTSYFDLGKRKIMFANKNVTVSSKDRNSHIHWGGFEMGFNNFMTSHFSSTLPKGYEFLDVKYNRSVTVNLNLIEKGFRLKHDLFLVTGLGIEWDNFKFSKNISLVPNEDTLKATYNRNDYNVDKLTICMINVPLLLELHLGHHKNNNFHIAAGVIAGYNWYIYTKEDYSYNGTGHLDYQHNNFGMEPFRYSATIRAGYDDVNFFATYGVNNMFKNGIDVHPVTVGITFIGF